MGKERRQKDYKEPGAFIERIWDAVTAPFRWLFDLLGWFS